MSLTIYFISQSCLNKFSHKKFCQVSNVPSGIFSYGGSTVWVSIRKEIDPVIQKELPNFRLRYTQPDREVPSSHAGIRMLLDNQIDFAQFSILINEREYQLAGERGIKFKQIPVAIDGAGIAVHPSLNITGLTVDQFHKIYEGKITNWNQIGGPNLEIIPYGKKDRDFGNHIVFVPTTTEAFRQLANNPGGIYYTSATLVLSQCSVKPLPVGRNINTLVPPYKEPFVPLSQCPQKYNQLNMKAFETGEYPLSRRLSVVIKQNGQIEEKSGEAYANLLLTNQGQELLEKVGFVRIR
jgi:phosphate transport system substrate-binding protein